MTAKATASEHRSERQRARRGTSAESSHEAAKIAGAPISWGVCEVPGWGFQLDPARVLAEMGEVGLTATEFGPAGFLPAAPDEMAATLDTHHLEAVGGFTPLLLHVPDHDPVPEVREIGRAHV